MSYRENNEKVIDSEILRCNDCGQNLIEVISTENNEDRMELGLRPLHSVFKVLGGCPVCGGGSFPSRIFDGSTSVGTLSDNVRYKLEKTEVVADTTINDDVIYNEFFLEKVK